jgi:serine protease Do
MSRALLVALALAGSPAAADPLGDLEAAQIQLYQRTRAAVVYIEQGGTIGSGFFVERGLILTNRHVVGAEARVQVRLRDGRVLEGAVVERASGDIDLALVEVPVRDVEPLELSLASPAIGAWIASIGHGVDSPWTFTTGMVSNVYRNPAGLPVLQTQVPLNPGNSGGPIFDRHGKVVAIVTKGMQAANSVNFAIGAEVATRALRRLARVAAPLVIRAPAGVAVFVDGQLAGTGPEVRVAPGVHAIGAVIGGALIERRTAPGDRELALGVQ